MKAITVKQPWASLIIHGGKDIENRNWHTNLRGRVAIHSSAVLSRAEIYSACAFMESWIRKFSSSIFEREALTYPTGSIIGTVEIVDCVSQSNSPWFMGQYGFVLRDPKPLPSPIKIKGALGFWEVPADISELLERPC